MEEISGFLIFTRTCYFAILDRTSWGMPYKLICPVIRNEIRNKDKGEASEVLNPTIHNFPTAAGHILTFTGQTKQQNVTSK